MTTVQMMPPSDGSRNSVTVSGRTYSSLPQMATSVQSFDAPTLAANGWQYAVTSKETWAARLRRLRGEAINNNPLESPQLDRLRGVGDGSRFGGGRRCEQRGASLQDDRRRYERHHGTNPYHRVRHRRGCPLGVARASNSPGCLGALHHTQRHLHQGLWHNRRELRG